MTSRVESAQFKDALERDRALVEARLPTLIGQHAEGPAPITDAVRYMILDAGKRLRPILCLWTHNALGGSRESACVDLACAIECLHTYSLIHDDLPCMDDDDLRRGRPSCHVKYGEAMAVLAGDALLTLCFGIIASLRKEWDVPSEMIVDLLDVVSGAAGTRGLIGGQVRDMTSGAEDADLGLVNDIHREKTAALIAASMETGAITAGASKEERDAVRKAGIAAGRAFQIVDDVLDIETDAETLGKTPGKDERDGKLTYPSVAGVESSREKAAGLIAEAGEALGGGPGMSLLLALFDYLVHRRA